MCSSGKIQCKVKCSSADTDGVKEGKEKLFPTIAQTIPNAPTVHSRAICPSVASHKSNALTSGKIWVAPFA